MTKNRINVNIITLKRKIEMVVLPVDIAVVQCQTALQEQSTGIIAPGV
jgi:hypothetical protein